MSMRYTHPALSRATIDQFLDTLSQFSPEYGRLYLAGEAAIVRLGLRSGKSTTIDLVVDAFDAGQMFQALQRTMEMTRINVQLTSPEDHIPVPWNWDARARYIGTYGALEAYYFDLPSEALAKIVFSNQDDLNDVQLMIQHRIITLNEVDDTYLEVQPRMGKRPYEHIEPQAFATHYAQIRKWLASSTRNTTSLQAEAMQW